MAPQTIAMPAPGKRRFQSAISLSSALLVMYGCHGTSDGFRQWIVPSSWTSMTEQFDGDHAPTQPPTEGLG